MAEKIREASPELFEAMADNTDEYAGPAAGPAAGIDEGSPTEAASQPDHKPAEREPAQKPARERPEGVPEPAKPTERDVEDGTEATNDDEEPGVSPGQPTLPGQKVRPTPHGPAVEPGEMPAKTPEEQAQEQARGAAEAAARAAAGRANFEAELSKQYALSPEQEEAMILNPGKVMPGLAARLHTDVYEAVVHTVLAQLPGLVGQVNITQRTYSENESQFYSKWPELKGIDPKKNDLLGKMAQNYRREFPDASLDEAIEDVGALAVKKFGLKRQAATGGNGATVAQPFRSAVGSRGAAAAPRAKAPANIFAELAMMEDD
jgi:hypothetical protein